MEKSSFAFVSIFGMKCFYQRITVAIHHFSMSQIKISTALFIIISSRRKENPSDP